MDARGRVLVADSRACFVAAFDSADARAGCEPLEIGEKGNASNQFAGPAFLAVSRSNNILVSDNHKIKVRLCGARLCTAGCSSEWKTINVLLRQEKGRSAVHMYEYLRLKVNFLEQLLGLIES